MGRPGGEVLAQGVGAVGEPVGLVDRSLGFALEEAGSLPTIPAGLGYSVFAVAAGVSRDPDDLPGRIAAFDWRLSLMEAPFAGRGRRLRLRGRSALRHRACRREARRA